MQLIVSIRNHIKEWLPGGSPTLDRPDFDARASYRAASFTGNSLATDILAALKRHVKACEPLPDRVPLWLLKLEVAKVVQDCRDEVRDGMSLVVYQTDSAPALWALLEDVRRSVACDHGSQAARSRIEGLKPLFAGWLSGEHLLTN